MLNNMTLHNVNRIVQQRCFCENKAVAARRTGLMQGCHAHARVPCPAPRRSMQCFFPLLALQEQKVDLARVRVSYTMEHHTLLLEDAPQPVAMNANPGTPE